jgi:hypothetical protein
MLAASYVGTHIQEQNYLPVVVVSVIAGIVFLVGVIKKDLIIEKLHRILHKD